MPFTTEAFVLEQVNSDFKLETVELDDPQDEEVLVEGVSIRVHFTKSLLMKGFLHQSSPAVFAIVSWAVLVG